MKPRPAHRAPATTAISGRSNSRPNSPASFTRRPAYTRITRPKSTQPLSADSAGCCFRNPTLTASIDGIGDAGERVSAGLLLDRAGCKGLRHGGAVVSTEHANFIIAEAGASATDVISLLGDAAERVRDAFGVEIEREVVIWQREGEP